MNILHKIFRACVFKVGDTKWLGMKHFPFFATWAVSEHLIDLNEIMKSALPLLKEGDIILHRDDWFASNIAIGGAMIHAGIYVGNDQVIEAISEGVVKRHVGHILQSDRACILRPRVETWEKIEACGRANQIVGFDYDYLFDFNGQEERRLLDTYGAKAKEHGVKFCCTEIPYYCYFDSAQRLRLYRKRNVTLATRFLSLIGLHPGELIIDGDMYVVAEFDLIWCSKEFTPKWAESMGCSEEYVAKLRQYWRE